MSAEPVEHAKSGPKGEYVLSLGGREPYELSAMLLTLLLYPEWKEPDTTLDQRFGEVCAYVLRWRTENSPAWAETPERIRPMHAFVDFDSVMSMRRTLEAELPKRVVAGEFALPFIEDVRVPKAPLPTGVRRLSQNSVAERLAETTGVSSASNFMTRVARPAYPVLHLCAAIAAMGRTLRREGLAAAPFDLLMLEATAVQWVVDRAAEYRPLIALSPKLPIGEGDMLRVSFQEVGSQDPPTAN